MERQWPPIERALTLNPSDADILADMSDAYTWVANRLVPSS